MSIQRIAAPDAYEAKYVGRTELNPPNLVNCHTEVRVSALAHDQQRSRALFDPLITVRISTGCSVTQSYATAAQARQLAHQLLCAAETIERAGNAISRAIKADERISQEAR